VTSAGGAADAETEVERLDASTYEAGRLTVATSPSLFGGGKVVVVDAVDKANDAPVPAAPAPLPPPRPARPTGPPSPSLFGGGKVVVVDAVDKANDALVTDATAYVRSPD